MQTIKRKKMIMMLRMIPSCGMKSTSSLAPISLLKLLVNRFVMKTFIFKLDRGLNNQPYQSIYNLALKYPLKIKNAANKNN